MPFKPSLMRVLAPAGVTALTLAACAPFLSPIGNPWSPSSATASTPERIARTSVPIASAVNQASAMGELVPGLSVPASVVERWTSGYVAEMERQINGLEDRLQASLRDPSRQAPDPSDWVWALGLAAAAGGANVFSFRQGQKTPPKGSQ